MRSLFKILFLLVNQPSLVAAHIDYWMPFKLIKVLDFDVYCIRTEDLGTYWA